MTTAQVTIYSIKNLGDLKKALSEDLKKGDRILLGDESSGMQEAVFLSHQPEALHGNDVIVTVEKNSRVITARGLYIINDEGLFYQASCDGEQPIDAQRLVSAGLITERFASFRGYR